MLQWFGIGFQLMCRFNISRFVFRVALFLILWACHAGPASGNVYRPLWIERPKGDDGIYTYRIGFASGFGSEPQAWAAAFENALDSIVDDIMARGGVPLLDRSILRARFAIEGVEPVPDAVHFEKDGSKFSCWIQVSFPISERDRLMREVGEAKDALIQAQEERDAFNASMRELWQQARAAVLRGAHNEALKNLLELEQGYGSIRDPGFDLEEVRLLLGDTYKELKNPLGARAAYETVSGISTSAVWKADAEARLAGLPSPPRFWPMHSRWNAGKVALVCVLREGGDTGRFQDLVNILTRDCAEAHLKSVDITARLDAGALAAFFDKMDFTKVSGIALSNDADIVLGVIYDIDPAKKGVTTENFGVAMPVPDAVIRFFVVDPRVNSSLFNGQFREVTGGRPESVLAERAALLLISRHLIPSCPAL